ncbi:MAG TPA: helix-hairpin-helix domain-containing protein [Candidatus Aminicenantes bacterium]|nr:helix-hairpin-helix domain-containing protein [Candidatus Aminicenantes bacterium]
MINSRQGLVAVALVAALAVLGLASAYAQAPAPKAKVNINSASVPELETLPRIGPVVAQRIVDFRTKNGAFKRIEDIMKVQGIGEKVYETLKDLITVGGETAAK